MKKNKNKRRYQLAIFLLVIVLLVAFLFTSVFLMQGRRHYLQLNSTHLAPLELEAFLPVLIQNEDMIRTGKRIVIIGDSRAAHWPDPVLEGYQVVNRGIGAQTSAQVLQRYDYHVKPLEPTILLVQVGINDLRTLPLFPEQRNEIVSDLKTNIQAMVDRARDQKATVVLTTIFPIGKVPIEHRPAWSQDVGVAIEEVNTFIGSLAGKEVVVFDTYSILVGENGMIRPDYSQDMLHLNETGYDVLNREFEKMMIDLDSR